MRLDIGDLATYRPGIRVSEGLHLTPSRPRARQGEAEGRELLSVPSIAKRIGVPDSAVQEALSDDAKFAELTGSPDFVRPAMRVNLIDLPLANPELLKRLGFDLALLDGLSRLTRPALADRLSIGFRLPSPRGRTAAAGRAGAEGRDQGAAQRARDWRSAK